MTQLIENTRLLAPSFVFAHFLKIVFSHTHIRMHTHTHILFHSSSFTPSFDCSDDTISNNTTFVTRAKFSRKNGYFPTQ